MFDHKFFYLHQIGPVFLPDILNSQAYLEHLQGTLPGLIDDQHFPEDVRNNLIFMQDGAAPHWAIRVRNFLNQEWENRWIGRGGPIAWPARSPDLNPCDFFLWSYIKSHVYRGNMLIRDEAHAAIGYTFQNVPASILRNDTMGVQRRLTECLLREGRHIEQYLQ